MPSNDDKVRSWSRSYAALTGQEEPFLYASRPGDGVVRYVFQDKICLGYPEAERYMLRLLAEVETKETT